MNGSEVARPAKSDPKTWTHGMWATAAVFALAALAQLPLVDAGHVALDEGQLLMIGNRLVEGQHLYSDVYTGIFPGIYWITELLFRMFGVDILVTRYAQLVFNGLLVAAVWRFSLRLASPPAAWLAAVAATSLIYLSFPGLSFLSYSTVSLLCAMEAALAASDYATSARMRDGIRCGLLLAVAVVFKQNYGALALFSIAAGLWWSRPRGPLQRRSLIGAAVPVVLSGLGVAFAASLYLVATGSFQAFWESTVLTLLASQLTAFNQPMAPVFGEHTVHDGIFVFLYTPGILFCYLLIGIPIPARAPFLAAISVAVRLGYGAAWLALFSSPVTLWMRLRHESDAGTGRPAPARILIPFGVVMFFGMFPSAIWSHLAAILPALIPLLAALADDVACAVGSSRFVKPFRRRAALGFAGLSTLVIVVACTKIAIDVAKWNPNAFGIPHATLRVSDRDRHMFNEALAFLRDCARDDETVFLAPDMPVLYVATGKKNPTPYDLVVPGDVRDDAMVRDIEAAGTRCVVLADMMYPQFQPFPVLFPKLYGLLRQSFEVKGSVEYEKLRWEFLVRR